MQRELTGGKDKDNEIVSCVKRFLVQSWFTDSERRRETEEAI